MECYVLGDSIAQGVGKIYTGCQTIAQKGISAKSYNAKFNYVSSNSAIISLGSNNPNDVHLTRELSELRQRINAYVVYWIMPIHPNAQNAIMNAKYDGDILIYFQPSKDGIHPKNYNDISYKIGYNRH